MDRATVEAHLASHKRSLYSACLYWIDAQGQPHTLLYRPGSDRAAFLAKLPDSTARPVLDENRESIIRYTNHTNSYSVIEHGKWRLYHHHQPRHPRDGY